MASRPNRRAEHIMQDLPFPSFNAEATPEVPSNRTEGSHPPTEGESQPPPPKSQTETGTHSALAVGGESDDCEPQGAIPTAKKVRTAPHVAQYRTWKASEYEGTEREANGYVMTWDTTTRAVFDLTDTLLDGYDDDSKHLFRHVYASGSRKRWERARWVPFYHGLWYAKLPYANPEAMEAAGLIEKKPAKQEEGLSAEYRVSPHVQAALDDLLFETVVDGRSVNLFTGKTTTRKEKSSVYDDNGNPLPAAVAAGIDGIRHAKVNAAAAWEVVERRRRVLRGAVRAFAEVSGLTLAEASERVNEARRAGVPMPFEGAVWEAYREAEEAQGRLAVDLAAFEGMKRQEAEDLGDGVILCRAAYEKQSTGRITDKGVLLQSATREMKAAAYGTLPSVYNYDWKSSQPRMLRRWFERYDLPIHDLVNLLERSKHEHAEHVGLTVDGWKQAVMALVMGALLYGSLERGTRGDGTYRGEVPRIVAENAAEGVDSADAYVRFHAHVEPLYEQLRRWRRRLVDVWLPEHEQYNAKGRFVQNDAGMPFYPDEHKPNALPRKLAAHLLQGQEAFLTHTLTKLSSEYGYAVLANEHDGLVTEGEIPEAAVELAKRIAGTPYAELEKKAFV